MFTFIQASYLMLLEVSPCSMHAICGFRGNLRSVLQLHVEVPNCSDTPVNFYQTLRHSISQDFNHDSCVASDVDLSNGQLFVLYRIFINDNTLPA